jgi:signal transduction histidine kinase
MVGKAYRVVLPAGHENEEDDTQKRILRGELVEHTETVRKRKNGEIVHVSVNASPIRNARGEIVGVSKIVRDISAKRQLERQLRQSQKMEALGQLTGGIAHDFNNLLGVIVGNLDLLDRLLDGNEKARKRVETAQKAATRGAELTRRLLAFSSKEELNPVSVSLQTVIQELMDLSGRTLGPEIRITSHSDGPTPQVYVDVAGLESALLNLVVNARDAMPKGGTLVFRTFAIDLDTHYPPVQTGELKPGRYACISVSDSGPGMSKETMERAFEPFFTTKPRHKGTGLGLAMVYGFMKQSGGTVRLYSEEGYGTTVSLYLPLQDVTDGPVIQAVPAQAPARLDGTALVVDDELPLLEIAHAYLADMGFTVLEAGDSATALGILNGGAKIDLLVTDIIMPGKMNGIELAQAIGQLQPGIRVVFTSGFPAEALAERSGRPVMGPLLRKPYLRSEFMTMVASAMGLQARSEEHHLPGEPEGSHAFD